MRPRHSFLLLLVALVTLVSAALAASPTSFCKCTCFGNSTIIALDSPNTTSRPRGELLEERKSKRTCADCNRQFCLGYSLSICNNAKDEDVFTTCFQRDSTKDQAVVIIFITATGGLLIYAALRPWVERRVKNSRERQTYMPVSNQDGQ